MARKSIRSYAKSQIVPYVSKAYGPLAAQAANYLLSKPASKAVSPAKVVTGTKLQSYLDRRYEKKCGVEVKLQDLPQSAFNLSTTLSTSISPFMGIAQGTTPLDRIGSAIEVKSCQFCLSFSSGSLSTAATRVRVILIKQGIMQQAAVPVATVLQDSTMICSPYFIDKNRSFTVLKDFTFNLSARTSGDKDTTYTWKYTYRPKKCHSVRWTIADTTGTVADAIEGNLALYLMYENTSGAVSAPSCQGYIRSEFVDV